MLLAPPKTALIAFLQYKKLVYGNTKISRHFKRQQRRGQVFIFLDGVDRLPCYPQHLGQLLLCDIFFGPLYFYAIPHLPLVPCVRGTGYT